MPRLNQQSASQRARNRRLRNMISLEIRSHSQIERELNASSQRDRRADLDNNEHDPDTNSQHRSNRRRSNRVRQANRIDISERQRDNLDIQNRSQVRNSSIERTIHQTRNTAVRRSTRLLERQAAIDAARELNASSQRDRRADLDNNEHDPDTNSQHRSNRRRSNRVRQANRIDISERQRDNLDIQNRSQVRNSSIERTIHQTRNTAVRRSTRLLERQAAFDAARALSQSVRRNRSNSLNIQVDNAINAAHDRQGRANSIQEEIIPTQSSLDVIIANYNVMVKHGPNIICYSCKGLWFPHQIKKLSHAFFENNDYEICADILSLERKYPSNEDGLTFCKTCHRKVVHGQKPNTFFKNGLDFPDLDLCLIGLTRLEERLISPRLPFMIIKSIGYERQSAIKGAVVNVPIPISNVVTSLPRTFHEAEVVQLHLKRRMEYRHDFMAETIRPLKIANAIRYLVNTELYRKHGVVVNEQWLSSFTTDAVPFIASEADNELVNELQRRNVEPAHLEEDEMEELNPGGQETLLENNEISNVGMQRIFLAPGEGQRPLDMVLDTDSEELSFPTIYAGKKRSSSLSLTKIVRSELRNVDRRACRIDKILFNYKKLELIHIRNNISICLRKQSASHAVTASNALSEDHLDNLIRHDQGYMVLKSIRTSPAHWEAEKKKVMAMIRQFGLPTFFITLSAAETKWTELLVLLKNNVDGQTITENEASNLRFLEKARLIRSDPVTCARYFDYRYRKILKTMKKRGGVFGDHYVVKYYWRVEFQHRGSPHIHGMFWLNNAPLVNFDNDSSISSVISFIDQFITTDVTDTDVEQYIDYQKHNHGHSCMREIRGISSCRFGIPYFPMPQTKILRPLAEETVNISLHRENLKRIRAFLNMSFDSDSTRHLNNFENFISHNQVNLTFENNILALRSGLKKPQIFLKRTLAAIKVNAYNKHILLMQRANIDIQFILDPYACCSYIINYINKSQRGISQLMRAAVNEIHGGNFTIKQKLQHIGHKFISGTEISAQEASYCCLGMALSETSNAEVYINTGLPEHRVRMLKSRQQLQNMPQDSTDIFIVGLLERYIQRPDCLESICLADFAANYNFSKSRGATRQSSGDNEDAEDIENAEEIEGNTSLPLRDGSGFIKERTKPRIIRFRKFNINADRPNYFRELLMLYFPWRDEQAELVQVDCESLYGQNVDYINSKYKDYNMLEDLEDVLRRAMENEEDLGDDQLHQIVEVDDEFRALAFPEISSQINVLNVNAGDTDASEDSNIALRIIKLPPLISPHDVANMVKSLNLKQKTYFTHVLHNAKINKVYHEFVGGGAGVGKSRLISSIFQSLSQLYNSRPGCDHRNAKILLCAPTGKAAFGIGGSTLHSMFSLPVNQSGSSFKNLGPDLLNTLRVKFIDVKVLIIDEISMVGAKMLSHLDSRLRQIFDNREALFGGISVIVFGDLRQLRPVGDRWIFQSVSTLHAPYSAIFGSSLWDTFRFFELTEIMRQRDDQDFALALNNMASGQMSANDISLLRSRVYLPDQLPNDAIHLFLSNEDTNVYNTAKLSSIPTDQYISRALDSIKAAHLNSQAKARCLESVKNFKTSQTQGLCSALILKTSAKYMMTVNVDTADGLVNGATGILMEIGFNSSNSPQVLWIKFVDDSVGINARAKYTSLTDPSWTPIQKTIKNFQFHSNEQVSIDRKQFPIVPAEGITIHKSQGATYTKVVVHTNPGMKREALYVACSRATSAAGLFIVGQFVPPKADRQSVVEQELEKLRSTKLLNTHFSFLFDTAKVNAVFHNTQSLHCHITNISSDQLMLQSSILCFVETSTYSNEVYEIPGFRSAVRLDCQSTSSGGRPKRGILVFAKNEAFESISDCLSGRHYSDSNNLASAVFEFAVFKYKSLTFLIIYKSPTYPTEKFVTEFENLFHRYSFLDTTTIILGDFNLCLRTLCGVSRRVYEFLMSKSYNSLLDLNTSTTNYDTHIDWAFSNIYNNRATACTYETTYSYHSGIVVSVDARAV